MHHLNYLNFTAELSYIPVYIVKHRKKVYLWNVDTIDDGHSFNFS